jgi:hypothetical protein
MSAVVLRLGLAALVASWWVHRMSETTGAKGVGYILDAVGVTLLIVGGEIAGTAIAKSENTYTLNVGCAIFVGGLVFLLLGIRWNRLEETLKEKGISAAHIAIGFSILSWLLIGYDLYSRPSSFMWLYWGTQPPTTQCTAAINGSQLMQWKEEYHVVLVCGFGDPTKDRLEDARITISRPFTVSDGAISISAPYSSAMIDGLRETAAPVFKATPKANAVEIYLWFRIALIRKDSDLSNIHRLSDVARNGGQLIDQEVGTNIALPKTSLNLPL